MLITLTIRCLSVSTRYNCWFQLSCIVSVSVFHAPFGCQLKRHPTWQWRLYNRIASLSCTCEEPREVGQLCEHADVTADSSLFSLLSRLLIGLHRLKTTTVRGNVHFKNTTENSTTPCHGTANMSDIVSCPRKKVGSSEASSILVSSFTGTGWVKLHMQMLRGSLPPTIITAL